MLTAIVINLCVVALAVIVHYEFLHYITRLIPTMSIRARFRIVFGVFAALIAHTLEIWIFAVAYWLKVESGQFGSLHGNFDGSLLDCLYFSFTVYTTLGFGDIYPEGLIRFMIGFESLTGLVLITWTASFLYYEMQRLWSSG